MQSSNSNLHKQVEAEADTEEEALAGANCEDGPDTSQASECEDDDAVKECFVCCMRRSDGEDAKQEDDDQDHNDEKKSLTAGESQEATKVTVEGKFLLTI